MSGRIALGLLVLAAACAPTGKGEAVAQPAPAPAPAAWARACKSDAGWDDPGPPFRIHGNSYYVGTCGIAAILIAGDEGHVLIDGGTEAGGGLIAANIESLGFKLGDVELLLHSHEHFDHVAGLAELQRRSGARLLASAAAAPVLASGETADDDPQDGMHEAFPPARVDGRVTPGQPVRLGSVSLTPVATPGHTPGALSWQWRACEGADCRTIVYADSLSAISSDEFRFSDRPAYVAEYRAGLARLAQLECATILTPHPVASDLHRRASEGLPADPTGCRRYAETLANRLDTRLAEEAARP
jgi:metallo-beta-lactamase class B